MNRYREKEQEEVEVGEEGTYDIVSLRMEHLHRQSVWRPINNHLSLSLFLFLSLSLSLSLFLAFFRSFLLYFSPLIA